MIKELVIFDVDNTIIAGQSQALFINYLYKMGYVSTYYYLILLSWVVLYKFGLVTNPLKPMKYGLSFARGKKIDEVQIIVDHFFNSILIKKIYKEVFEIVSDHKRKNRDIILVSNAPDILIKKIAEHLEIKNFLSTQLEINNGVYTGNIFGEIMYGEQKLLAAKKYIESTSYSLETSWAYGDHDSDEYLLSNVGHPYAVNPSTKLRKTALKNNWPILKFNL